MGSISSFLTTPMLDRVQDVSDLRCMRDDDLLQLADELRAETVSIVSETGGHLGSSLGVIELTVAIHAVFDTPVTSSSGMSAINATRTRC